MCLFHKMSTFNQVSTDTHSHNPLTFDVSCRYKSKSPVGPLTLIQFFGVRADPGRRKMAASLKPLFAKQCFYTWSSTRPSNNNLNRFYFHTSCYSPLGSNQVTKVGRGPCGPRCLFQCAIFCEYDVTVRFWYQITWKRLGVLDKTWFPSLAGRKVHFHSLWILHSKLTIYLPLSHILT